MTFKLSQKSVTRVANRGPLAYSVAEWCPHLQLHPNNTLHFYTLGHLQISWDVFAKNQLTSWAFASHSLLSLLHNQYHIISIATPPIEDCIWVYWVTYYGQLSMHYFCCSYFLTLYIKYIFIFQPDAVEGLSGCKLRWKTFFWKILLTVLGMWLSSYFPLQEEPAFFKLLTKGTSGSYNR